MKFIYPANGQKLEAAACKLAIRKSFILFYEFARRRIHFLHVDGFWFQMQMEARMRVRVRLRVRVRVRVLLNGSVVPAVGWAPFVSHSRDVSACLRFIV